MKYAKLLFIFSVLCTHTLAYENVATIKNIKGNVLIKQKDIYLKSTSGLRLSNDNIIITKKGSSADIIFDEGSTLALGENSFLSINKYVFKPLKNNYDFDLTLKKGVVVFKSGKIGKLSPKSFKMRFPKGIIGIRGTKFLLRVE